MARDKTPKNTLGLPDERDFDPHGGFLDAQWAWKNFGGLTIEAAHLKFRENPLNYQEDFMFMGGKAFVYYYPVIDSYLRDTPEDNDGDDRESWILAHCIKAQFDVDTLADVRRLAPRVLELADFVRTHIQRFGSALNEQNHIATAWDELVRHIDMVTKKI